MKNMLPDFIRYLEQENLIVLDIEGNFDTRFWIQKCVFLAKFYGLDLQYTYDMYLYGPYSTELTQAYYDAEKAATIPAVAKLPESFRSEAFLKMVKNRENKWLEIAATIMKLEPIYGLQDGSASLISKAHRIKHNCEIDFVTKVFDDLKRIGLLSNTRIDHT